MFNVVNLMVRSLSSYALDVTSGNVIIVNAALQSIDTNFNAIRQTGGFISVNHVQLFNNSLVNETVKSTSGIFKAVGGSMISNLAGGPAADINNSATIGQFNSLSGVSVWGTVTSGTAATEVTGCYVYNGSLSGTNLFFDQYYKTFSIATNSCSITGDGSVATVTQSNHGYINAQTITISGTTNFNGVYIVTYIDPSTYTVLHAFAGGPESGVATPLDPWGGVDPNSRQDAIDRITVALTSHLNKAI
jgi:hypothetical protein